MKELTQSAGSKVCSPGLGVSTALKTGPVINDGLPVIVLSSSRLGSSPGNAALSTGGGCGVVVVVVVGDGEGEGVVDAAPAESPDVSVVPHAVSAANMARAQVRVRLFADRRRQCGGRRGDGSVLSSRLNTPVAPGWP